jgi:copper chaperone NosL
MHNGVPDRTTVLISIQKHIPEIMKKLLPTSRIGLAIAALLPVIAYFTPIWYIWMWAPQYPEGLNLYIWLDNLSGDVEIINGLNHYIGMKYIKVEMFPEFEWMPKILGAVIALGVLMAIWGKRIGLWIFLIVFAVVGIAGMVDFWMWGYDYGHNLDPKAAIKVPGMAYQPPLIGSKELLNFIAYSAPATGGWAFIVAGLLALSTLILELFKNK